MEYLRGSEWRRWDFHLHTPFTKKNDLYSGNGDEKWAQFYADVISYIGDGSDPQRKIAAVGITDYFSIENYKKIKADGILDKYIDFIFPNIELRCLPLKDGVMMNVHLLINPTFVDKVDTIVLSNLKYKFSTGEYCARKEDLIRYGKDLEIILVTHNANLVLGCDAEEVIVANQQIAGNSLTKNESFRFEYRSGSIENITITNPETFLGTKGIQNHICNILEGGKEAFIARKNKYTNL